MCREEIRLEEDCLFGLVNSTYVHGRKKNATIKAIYEKEVYYIEKSLLRNIMSLWVSLTNFVCRMSRLLQELVWKLLKEYFKLLKEPNNKIRWPLLEQMGWQL